MATYTEIFDVYSNTAAGSQALLNKIVSAVLISAESIRNEATNVTNHANRVIWSKQAFSDPGGKAKQMFGALLASNNTLTQSQILNAADSGIQTAVDNAVNIFADGF